MVFCFRDTKLNLVSTNYFCWTCLPWELQASLILVMSINHSKTENSTYHFFFELNKTGCFHRLKISHQWTNCVVRGVSTSKIYFLCIITIRLEVHFVVFLCNIITRNESFNRHSPFSRGNNWNVINDTLCCDTSNFDWNFAAIFTLTVNNYELYSDWI